jgi:hypothetical protein
MTICHRSPCEPAQEPVSDGTCVGGAGLTDAVVSQCPLLSRLGARPEPVSHRAVGDQGGCGHVPAIGGLKDSVGSGEPARRHGVGAVLYRHGDGGNRCGSGCQGAPYSGVECNGVASGSTKEEPS